jgi:sigma-E factor negative regulatory protein RseB
VTRLTHSLLVFLAVGLLWAKPDWVAAETPQADQLNITAWLTRAHEASRYRAYTGTFVVSAGGSIASARIWHACQGNQQIERVDSLSGTPRATFRRNDHVVTFFPQSRVAVVETRDSLGLFPGLLNSSDSAIPDFYRLKSIGSARIAGFDAEVVQLLPVDSLRYGYRVWTEKRTGLVVQLQTLDLDGRVLEQSAFSDLQLDAPVNVAKLHQLMGSTSGYRVERPVLQTTSAAAQGWTLHQVVAGFRSMGCYQRPVASADGTAGRGQGTMQWIFADGLATVSLFVEAFDAQHHGREGYTDMGGATHTLTRRIDDSWVTAVGEVPISTLMAFVLALEPKN